MDLAEPASVIAPGLTAVLLRALAARSGGATSEQLRRVAGRGTPAGVRRSLERLAEHGVVTSMRVGEVSALYELNREHVLYPVVQALVEVQHVLLKRLAEAIAGWTHAPVTVALFGSAARGDGGPDSDIDVLVVRPEEIAEDEQEWIDQLIGLRGQVRDWTGNHLQILERTVDELAGLIRDGEAIVEELRHDAISLFGSDLGALLKDLR